MSDSSVVRRCALWLVFLGGLWVYACHQSVVIPPQELPEQSSDGGTDNAPKSDTSADLPPEPPTPREVLPPEAREVLPEQAHQEAIAEPPPELPQDARPSDQPPQDTPVSPLAFCQKQRWLQVGGQEIKNLKVTRTGLMTQASCCPAGEIIVLEGEAQPGQVDEFSFGIVKLPNTSFQSPIDLANPPAGWFIRFRCDGTKLSCDASPPMASTQGTLTLTRIPNTTDLELTVCMRATSSTSPNAVIELSLHAILIHRECEWQQDLSCNADPRVSSIRGKCEPDSTCTCNPGATKVPQTGKCQ